MKPPQSYTTAGVLMIISGLFTAMASLALVGGLIWVCVGVFWILPLIVGIVEIGVGALMLGGSVQPRARAVSILGIVAALLSGNLIGLVCEIVAMVQLGSPEVDRYLLLGD
jgi:hypothetical protein